MSVVKEKNFEALFRTHYAALHRYAFRFIPDSDEAEEIIQQVFLRLWEKDWEENIHTSLKAYLYRAVYNSCINFLNKEKQKAKYQQAKAMDDPFSPAVDQSPKDLQQHLQYALAGMPERSRTVFELSRFQEMKYKDIATVLNLSIKTVEGHMSKALKHLRIELIDFLTVLIAYIYFKS